MNNIKEIKDRFGSFSDSWISKIEKIENTIKLVITCSNIQKSNNYEIISLVFIDTIEFNVVSEFSKMKNIVIKDALLEYNSGNILFDIDPIDHFDYLKENDNSEFKIKSKEIKFEFLDYYSPDGPSMRSR